MYETNVNISWDYVYPRIEDYGDRAINVRDRSRYSSRHNIVNEVNSPISNVDRLQVVRNQIWRITRWIH